MNKKIDSLTSLEDMFEYAKNNKFLKYIHKDSFPTITSKKMKNFLLACEEEVSLKTKIESLNSNTQIVNMDSYSHADVNHLISDTSNTILSNTIKVFLQSIFN